MLTDKTMYKTMQALKQTKKNTPPNCIVATSQKRMRYWWDLIESNKLNTWQVEKKHRKVKNALNEIQNCYKILPLTDQRPCHKAFNESQ